MSYLFLISGVVLILSLIYYYIIESFKFWSKHNISTIEPKFPLGNLNDVGTKIHFVDAVREIYEKFKKSEKLAGFYFFTSPRLIIIDPDLIKQILVKDFNIFRNRGIFHDDSYEPLSGHLFNLHGEKWTEFRRKLSPTFTSGKMKMMFPTIKSKTNDLFSFMDELIKTKNPIDIKDVCVRYTADVIALSAFGVDCNCLTNVDSDFMKETKRIFNFSGFKRRLEFFVSNTFQKLGSLLKIRISGIETEKYFMKLISDAVEYREKNSGNHNDFLNLLINIHKHGIVKGEKDEDVGKMTFNEMAAQAFVFLVAGFETTSTAMHFAFYELAKNQDIQQRARDEVKSVLEKHNGEMTYDAVMELHYIQQIINGNYLFI